MPRTAVSIEDKIAKAASAELTASEQLYFDWIAGQAESAGVKVAIDEVSFKLARGLYNDYLQDPDVAAANAERKAQRDAEKAEKELKAIDRAKKLLAARGFVVELADDDEDDEDDE